MQAWPLARSRWPRPRRRPRSAGCRLRNGSRLFALFAPSQHVGSAASKNLSSMNDSTREGGRVQARLRRRNRLCMQHQHEEPICLHLFEQFHKNRGTIQHMGFTLGSGSLTGKGQNTAWSKKKFPLFEIPASFLPNKMASPCTANWP